MKCATDQQQKPSGNQVDISRLVQGDVQMFAIYSPELKDALSADLEARAEMGRAKYGERLRAANGRDPLVDMYQEVLDGLQYGKQAMVEGEMWLAGHYGALLRIAFTLRQALTSKGKP